MTLLGKHHNSSRDKRYFTFTPMLDAVVRDKDNIGVPNLDEAVDCAGPTSKLLESSALWEVITNKVLAVMALGMLLDRVDKEGATANRNRSRGEASKYLLLVLETERRPCRKWFP